MRRQGDRGPVSGCEAGGAQTCCRQAGCDVRGPWRFVKARNGGLQGVDLIVRRLKIGLTKRQGASAVLGCYRLECQQWWELAWGASRAAMLLVVCWALAGVGCVSAG